MATHRIEIIVNGPSGVESRFAAPSNEAMAKLLADGIAKGAVGDIAKVFADICHDPDQGDVTPTGNE
jgi:hypothetical protein